VISKYRNLKGGGSVGKPSDRVESLPQRLRTSPNTPWEQKINMYFLSWDPMTWDPTIMGKSEKMRLRTRVWAQASKPSSFAELGSYQRSWFVQFFNSLEIIKYSRSHNFFWDPHCWRSEGPDLIYEIPNVEKLKDRISYIRSPLLKNWRIWSHTTNNVKILRAIKQEINFEENTIQTFHALTPLKFIL